MKQAPDSPTPSTCTLAFDARRTAPSPGSDLPGTPGLRGLLHHHHRQAPVDRFAPVDRPARFHPVGGVEIGSPCRSCSPTMVCSLDRTAEHGRLSTCQAHGTMDRPAGKARGSFDRPGATVRRHVVVFFCLHTLLQWFRTSSKFSSTVHCFGKGQRICKDWFPRPARLVCCHVVFVM